MLAVVVNNGELHSMNPVADRPNNSACVLIIPSISAGSISAPLIASGKSSALEASCRFSY